MRKQDLPKKSLKKVVKEGKKWYKKTIGEPVKKRVEQLNKNLEAQIEQVGGSILFFSGGIAQKFESFIEANTFEKDIETESGSDIITKTGVKVRSKAEMAVANTLTDLGLTYEYETKFHYNDYQYILPDFYLPSHDCYIEYWGLVDAKGELGEKYKEQMEWKKRVYRANKTKVVFLYPSDLMTHELINKIKDRLEQYGKEE